MAKRSILVRLPDDLELDLRAFAEAHYDASMNTIIAEALRRFIEARLAEEPAMRKRFEKHRQRDSGGPLRVIGAGRD